MPNEQPKPLTGWRKTADSAISGLLGALGLGDDSTASRAGEFLTGLPVLGAALPVKSLLHSWDDIKRIASGSGPIRLYHGTTAENAVNMLKHGVQLPESGEAAARRVADLYEIPWTEWRHRVEPQSIGAGYGTETSRLSTAPYPVAHKWSRNFPQGEIYTNLNQKARLYSEARRRGISYEDMYNEAARAANQKGMFQMEQYPDALDLPDLMKPSGEPGKVLAVDTDVRALQPGVLREAERHLKDVGRYPDVAPHDILKFWNTQYKDIKVPTRSIKGLELALPR